MSNNNNEAWEDFLNNSTVGVHLVDQTGTILWANNTELNLLGYSEEEYFGRHIKDFHVDKDVIETIINLLVDGTSLSTYPARLRAKNEETKFVLINSNIYTQDDEFVHTRCFTTEISESIYFSLRSEMIESGG
ncbi:MAG: PAS domain-containing protein [Planctomycetes bacterium]|nr:PAS domain-containing protein [Planctomycetota bacterium]